MKIQSSCLVPHLAEEGSPLCTPCLLLLLDHCRVNQLLHSTCQLHQFGKARAAIVLWLYKRNENNTLLNQKGQYLYNKHFQEHNDSFVVKISEWLIVHTKSAPNPHAQWQLICSQSDSALPIWPSARSVLQKSSQNRVVKCTNASENIVACMKGLIFYVCENATQMIFFPSLKISD